MIGFEDVFFGTTVPTSVWKTYNGSLDGSVTLGQSNLYVYDRDDGSRFSCLNACMLDDNVGVLCTLAGNRSGEYLDTMRIVPFRVTGTSVTLGTTTAIGGSFWFVNGYCCALCPVDGTRMIMVTATSGISGQARVLTIDTGALTVGVGPSSSPIGSTCYQCFKLASDRIVGVARNPVIWDVSGTAVSGSYLFPTNPYYPYGNSSGGGRIDDTHYWVNDMPAFDTWTVDVVAVSGTSGTVIQQVSRSGNGSVQSYKGATELMYYEWNGANGLVKPFAINPVTYVPSYGPQYATQPGEAPFGNGRLPGDGKAHVGFSRSGSSYTARVMTYDTGDVVTTTGPTVYTWGSLWNMCSYQMQPFPTSTNKILTAAGDGSNAHLKILRAA